MNNDNQQSVLIHIPYDGSCLFWSVTLAYLYSSQR